MSEVELTEAERKALGPLFANDLLVAAHALGEAFSEPEETDAHLAAREAEFVERVRAAFLTYGWTPPAHPAADDRDTALCQSCGELAIHLIILNGVPTPVCLRHLNVWRTPPDTALRERVVALANKWTAEDDTTQWGNHDKSACAHALREVVER